MTLKDKKHLIVVYHDNCIDGLAAAWAFDRKWAGQEDRHISYIPYQHHNAQAAEDKIKLEMTPGADIHFADVAPSKEFLDILMAPMASGLPPARSVAVTDHHKSAATALKNYTPPQDSMAPALSLHIDDTHPSAVWSLLMPDQPPPVFLSMIAKMDLSRDLKEEHDLAASALIDSKNISTVADAFCSFIELERMTMHDMVVIGLNILSDQQNRINRLSDNILYTQISLEPDDDMTWVPVINADVQNFGRSISDYLREQGDRTGLGMAFAWYMQGNGSSTMSIRSDGDPDASTVADILCRHEGVKGGGHKTSAAVHFSSLQQFSTIVPLYTQQQMEQTKEKGITEMGPPQNPRLPDRRA